MNIGRVGSCLYEQCIHTVALMKLWPEIYHRVVLGGKKLWIGRWVQVLLPSNIHQTNQLHSIHI